MTSYTVLKPLCDAIASSPTASNIAALHSAITAIAPHMLQVTQDFVLLLLVNQIDSPAQT